MVHIVLFFVSVLLLVGCQTAPTRYENFKQGSWQAKMLVRDKVKNKSVIVNVDIKSIAFSKLRIDATSAIGGHLASFVLFEDQVSYIMVPQRRYFKGRVNGRSLQRVLGMDMDPRLIYNMLFDQAPLEKDWACVRGKKGYLSKCRNLRTKVIITWKNRDAGRKLVQLDHARGTLQMDLKGFSPSIKQGKKVFKLKIPRSFRKI